MELFDVTTAWTDPGDVRFSTIKKQQQQKRRLQAPREEGPRRLEASDTAVTTNTAVTTGNNPKPFGLDVSLRNGYLKASLGEGSTISSAAQAVADATGDAAAVAAGAPLPDDPTTLDQDDAVVGAAAAGAAAGSGAAGGLQSNQRVVLMTNGQGGSDMTTVAVIAGAAGATIIVLALILVMVRRRGDQAGPQQQSVVYPVMPTSQIHGARHVDPSAEGGFVTDKVEKVARSM